MPSGWCSFCGETSHAISNAAGCEKSILWRTYGKPIFKMLRPGRRIGPRNDWGKYGRPFFVWMLGTQNFNRRCVNKTSRRYKGGRDLIGSPLMNEIGYTHNPELPGHRWIEPMKCADDTEDSWDDATYLGMAFRHFYDPDDGTDPFVEMRRLIVLRGDSVDATNRTKGSGRFPCSQSEMTEP